jgi:hypothetical protein
MKPLVTSNTIERPETTQGSEYGRDACKRFTGHSLNPLKASLPCAARGKNIISGETGSSKTDECTDEIDEIDEREEREEINELEEADESEETEGLNEREEVATLGPKLSAEIDKAIFDCRVSGNRDVNRPLFMLAHTVRSIEEELNVRFSVDVIAETLRRWRGQNNDHLDNDHDYLTELLDKLSLVRFPRGRALLRAVEVARKVEPPKSTLRLSSDVQLLASLCGVLQRRAGKQPFYLDGRSAAKAVGRPHETVASWLRALCRLGVIRLITKGRRGMASRYIYLDPLGVKARGKNTSRTLAANTEMGSTSKY